MKLIYYILVFVAGVTFAHGQDLSKLGEVTILSKKTYKIKHKKFRCVMKYTWNNFEFYIDSVQIRRFIKDMRSYNEVRVKPVDIDSLLKYGLQKNNDTILINEFIYQLSNFHFVYHLMRLVQKKKVKVFDVTTRTYPRRFAKVRYAKKWGTSNQYGSAFFFDDKLFYSYSDTHTLYCKTANGKIKNNKLRINPPFAEISKLLCLTLSYQRDQ